MQDRILMFLPSVIVITIIAGITFLYLRWIVKRYKDNFKNVEWVIENKWKLVLLIGTPQQNILAPTAEELLFRAPIIIAFGAISGSAWKWIIVSAVIFSLIHWFGKKIKIDDIILHRMKGENFSNDMETEVNRLSQNKKEVRIRKVLNVILTLPLGILAGYYGILYQSIWVSVGVHALWNLVMPIIMPLIVIIIWIIFLILHPILSPVYNFLRHPFSNK